MQSADVQHFTSVKFTAGRNGVYCLRTWPPAGLTAKGIKAPLGLFDFPRREVYTLDILYLHMGVIMTWESVIDERVSYSCLAKVSAILRMSMQWMACPHPCFRPLVCVSSPATSQVKKPVCLPRKPA